MRVPRSWLRELVDVDVSTQELASTLSEAGVAVDKIERFAPGVGGIVAGRVVEVSNIPESRKLCVARVDLGEKGKVEVVAGARNFRPNDLVPVALPGARVTTLNEPVGVRRMLGSYESHGMLCSARELGIGDDHSGIALLGEDVPLGTDVSHLLGLDDDVLEFEIYPNRPDLMSVVGIAREVALLYRRDLRLPEAAVVEDGPPAAGLASLAVEDPAACPRYVARVVEGTNFGPSPLRVQARLAACGFRSLGGLVDATNYVLLLTGQPLHAFDLDRLEGGGVIVRRARPGEVIVTIDGVKRVLQPEDLVIADASRVQAVAGVMGGEASEVGPGTRRVLLESAYFDPRTVSRTARRLHLYTEASSRFERGTDPEGVGEAAALAAELVRRWAGGTVARGALEAGGPPERRRLLLRPRRIERVLGVRPEEPEVVRQLAGLGCQVSRADRGITVVVPSWRPDLEREIDLIEEVARLYGYGRIPPRHRPGRRGGRTATQLLRERTRQVLFGCGLSEATLSSFVAAEDLQAVAYDGPVVRLSNPMTVDQRQLRPTLVPGLVRAAQRNLDRGVQSVRLFELGTVFVGWPEDTPLPLEAEHVGFVLAGEAQGIAWYEEQRPFDAYDAKGVVEAVLAECGIPPGTLEWEGGLGGAFHPGRSVRVCAGGEEIGRLGELRPSARRAFGIEGPVVVGELRFGALAERARRELTVHPLPSHPATTRDLSLALDAGVAALDVERSIREAAGPLLEAVTLVDEYRGPQVGEGRRSLTFRLTFRAPGRTLRSAEADEARERAAEACRRRHAAEVR